MVVTAIFSITGYCDSCGVPPIGITSSMTETRWGIVACGDAFPFGTKFTIEDMGVFVCEDRGGAITDNRLDIWFSSCRAALEFGVRKRHVLVIMMSKEKDGSMSRLWTEEELSFLEKNWRKMTDAELATVLERTRSAVKGKRAKIGLYVKDYWTRYYDRCRRCDTSEVPHGAEGFCELCYLKIWRKANPDYERPLVTCQECGQQEPHHALGLCADCYRIKYYEENRDVLLETKRKWYQEHIDQARARGVTYYWNNRDRALSVSRQYYRNHRDKELQRNKLYYQTHPEKARMHGQRRRARCLGAAVCDLASGEWQKILEHYGHRCAYCSNVGDMTQDHIIPLSRGGWHTISNIAPACRSCNSKKSDKTPSEAMMYLWKLPMLNV